MRYYPKINSPLLRDAKGRFIPGQWADPVFEQHRNEPWYWYYKWNGTNVGMTADGWFGRTVHSAFTDAQGIYLDQWLSQAQAQGRLTDGQYLYGELIGPGIQGNPHNRLHLQVVEFELWDGAATTPVPVPYGLHTIETLSRQLTAHRTKRNLFGWGGGYLEGYVGRLVADPSVVTKIKTRDKWTS